MTDVLLPVVSRTCGSARLSADNAPRINHTVTPIEHMRDHTSKTEESTIDSLETPEELLDDEEVPVETNYRELEDETFEALQDRYDTMDGVIQFALTTDDGELLLQGWDGASAWAPPGGKVIADRASDMDWIDAAKKSAEVELGVDIDVHEVLLIEELHFQRSDGTDEFSSYGVSFGASLVNEDTEFIENPAFPDESPFADEDMTLAWVTDVPEDINENHREHIEQFLAYAKATSTSS